MNPLTKAIERGREMCVPDKCEVPTQCARESGLCESCAEMRGRNNVRQHTLEAYPKAVEGILEAIGEWAKSQFCGGRVEITNDLLTLLTEAKKEVTKTDKQTP